MTVTWPQKTSEMHNQHIDSTVWNDFKFRDDDIIISTYAKSGTTWMQQIISQKTHLPVEALVYSPKAKYIYIGRDGRDVLWSLYNHHAKGNEAMYNALNNSPGLVGPPLEPPCADIREYWHTWLDKDGFPYWSFWDNVRSWWAIRNLPNMMMVHFDVLKRRMPEEMRRIAACLDIPIDESKWDAIVEHCTFDWMREHGEKIVPLGGAVWVDGVKSFMNKGTNGRWKETLTAAESAEYEARALAELGPECAHWLATGEEVPVGEIVEA
jgi:aryl sulfotransferase